MDLRAAWLLVLLALLLPFSASSYAARRGFATTSGDRLPAGYGKGDIEARKARFVDRHGFPPNDCGSGSESNDTSAVKLNDPHLLDAALLIDKMIGVIGEDSIRAMTESNLLSLSVNRGVSQAANLKTRKALPNVSKKHSSKHRINTCAVIGSSGHLRAMEFGQNIDKFDLVARANQSPTKGYETHVGSKTTMRFLNEALTRRYRDSLGMSVMEGNKECFKLAMGLNGMNTRVINIPQGRKLLAEEGEAAQAAAAEDILMDSVDACWDWLLGEEAAHGADRRQLFERLGSVRGSISPSANFRLRLAKIANAPMCKQGFERISEKGRLRPGLIKFRSFMFPLERNVALTHINEFKPKLTEQLRFLANMKTLRPDVKMAMVNNVIGFLAEDLITKWAERLVCKGILSKKGGTRPTTGLMMILSLLPICKKVVLYGFGPAAPGIKGGEALDYHFFSGMLQRSWKTTSKDVHNFKAEYLLLKSLARKGRLTICNNANSPQCGLSNENLDLEQAKREEAEKAAAAVGAVQTDSEAVELSKAANMKFVDPDQVYEGLPRVEDEGDEL
mmetsp:Transcript_39226/g.100220  ORF Transcript_39226/g.100220 Transcript_39226/m.100220 type:complete len:561 (+) Transcript_39226:104-1786(+)|eukprot:jgi/Tetstr1/454678/TSEL_041567.t1